MKKLIIGLSLLLAVTVLNAQEVIEFYNPYGEPAGYSYSTETVLGTQTIYTDEIGNVNGTKLQMNTVSYYYDDIYNLVGYSTNIVQLTDYKDTYAAEQMNNLPTSIYKKVDNIKDIESCTK